MYNFINFALAQGFGQAPAPINIAPPADFGTSILNVINYILGFIGVVALAFFFYGVFRYITAGSNEDQLAESKGTMTGSLLGILIMGVSATLINFVVGFFTGSIGVGSKF
ncbi:MAG: hypothetical protein Q7S57_00185 [bacterium]|nr:hypothetical protein [bacterium]